MAPIVRSGNQSFGGRVSDEPGTPSNNLWVGNVSADISDSDLMALFSKHGVVDSVTTYPSRNYAFVYYRQIDDAKAAKQALQGHLLHGSSLKIEFARPAKPCKSLWVSGISQSVTKEILEEEFNKFGEIEEFKLLREKNTAYVDYFRLEDASQALKNMNGKRMGGGQIRVDFLRSNTAKKDQWVDSRDTRDARFTNRSIGPPDSPWMREGGGNFPEFAQPGLQRHQFSQSGGARKNNGKPSKILWVGYPPSVRVDEQMLHNAMILFGEIESIRSVPSRNFAFVEFRSIEEARRAKEGLQGRLFNDPRITIAYSSSEYGHGKDHPGFRPGGVGVEGPRADMFSHEHQVPHANLDLFNHPMGQKISGPMPSGGIIGTNTSAMPFVPQGRSEPTIYGPEFGDMTVQHKVPDSNHNSQLGGPNWRRSPPASGGILPLPTPGMKRPARLLSGSWDVFDASHGQSDSKRSRTDTGLPYDVSLGPEINGGSSGTLPNVQERRMITGGTGQGQMDHDYVWRGVISKGGSPVCRARCIPVGQNIDFEIPHRVNCSARTGLDMLTKHYAEAIGFEIVFFLPDSEDDFASYTEFLQYLGTRNRAGVAKCDDGTTLFLVPPSDFLYKVLEVSGPERLYGVVLKFPQHVPDNTSMQPQSFQSRYLDGQNMSSQNEYMAMPQKEEKSFQMDGSRVLSEDQLPMGNQRPQSTSESIPVPPAAGSTAVASHGGITLTPEIIATLASLLPAAAKSSGSDTPQHHLGPSPVRPLLSTSAESDRGIVQQAWTHDQPRTEQISYPLHQVDNQFAQRQLTQLQTYTPGLNTANVSSHVAGNLQPQDPAFNFAQQQGVATSRPPVSFGIHSNTANLAVTSQVGHHNQYEVQPQSHYMGKGLAHESDSLGSYGAYTYQQPVSNVAQGQTAVSSGGVTGGTSEFPHQAQQLQPAPYGVGQETAEAHMDKDQRYQSTLQFAANLLLQIQQQQQQQPQNMSTPNQGSGNQ